MAVSEDVQFGHEYGIHFNDMMHKTESGRAILNIFSSQLENNVNALLYGHGVMLNIPDDLVKSAFQSQPGRELAVAFKTRLLRSRNAEFVKSDPIMMKEHDGTHFGLAFNIQMNSARQERVYRPQANSIRIEVDDMILHVRIFGCHITM